MIRMWQRSGQNVELSQLQTRILTSDCQRLVSEGPWVNIHPPKASPLGGRGFVTANFQLLMLSPNLLKFQCPYAAWVGEEGGGLVTANFQLLMLSPNLLKSQIPYAAGGGGGGRGVGDGPSNFCC